MHRAQALDQLGWSVSSTRPLANAAGVSRLTRQSKALTLALRSVQWTRRAALRGALGNAALEVVGRRGRLRAAASLLISFPYQIKRGKRW
jgi:hypothetical protein